MKAFKVSECETWAAETLEEAKQDYLQVTSLSEKDAFEDFDPHELGEEALRRIVFVNDDGERSTLFDELERINDSGTTDPVFLASSEY